MKCPEASVLVDVLYEEDTTDDRGPILAHLEECPACQEQWTRLRAVVAAADRWTAPSPSPRITERALARIATERARHSPSERPLIASQELLGSLLFGVTAAGLSLFLTRGVHDEGESQLLFGLMGSLWTAVYAAVGFLVLQGGRYRYLAVAALVAAGITMFLTPWLPMPAVIEVSSRWFDSAQALSPASGGVLLAGLLFAAIPTFASSATITRGMASRAAMVDATWLLGLYALLIAPSVCLQCHPIALVLTVTWVAGMLVGAFLGCLGGVSLSARFRTVTA